MNLGQALAMMQYANQAKDYTNRYKATPTLDWADIASAPVDEYGATQPPVGQSIPPQFSGYPPIGEAIAGYAPPPMPDMAVAGYAPPQPPIEQRGVPAFMADQTFSELYGEPAPMPATRTMPMAFAPTSMEPTGVTGGLPSFAPPAPRMAAMPLPIPGRPVPPMAMTDVAPMEMIEPGRSLAFAQGGEGETQQMLRPNVPSQTKPFRVDVPAVPSTPFDKMKPQQVEQPTVEEKPKYEPGQPFPVTLTFGDKTITGTVEDFQPPRPNETFKGAIKFRMADTGKILNIPAANDNYNKILDQYRTLVSEDIEPADSPYTSRVLVDDKWIPARIDENTNEVYYVDPQSPELGEVKYLDNIMQIKPGENYRGPKDELGNQDMTQYDQAVQRVVQFTRPFKESIVASATGYPKGVTQDYLMRNLIPRFSPEKEPKEGEAPEHPLGSIEWDIIHPDTGKRISLMEAEASNLVPKGTLESLQSEFNQIKDMASGLADSAAQAQSGKQVTMMQNAQDTIQANLAELRSRLATADPETQKAINEQIKNLEQESIALLGGSPLVTKVAGSKIFEAPPTVTTYTINPRRRSDVLQLLSGASALPSQYQPKTNAVFTMNDIATGVKQQALQNFRPNAISVNPDYTMATSALADTLSEIEASAVEQFAERAPNILDEPAVFTYYDPISDPMQERPVVDKGEPRNPLTLRKVLGDYQAASTAYKNALSKNDAVEAQNQLEILAQAGKRLSGSIFIRNLGTFGQNNRMLREPLSYIPSLIDRPVSIDTSIPMQLATTPASKVSEPPKMDVEGPKAAREKKAEVVTPIYPIHYAAGQGNKQFPGKVMGYGSNLFSLFESTPELYTLNSANYLPGRSEATSNRNISQSLLNDSGSNLTDAQKAQVNTTIEDFNKKLSSDAGYDARRDIVQTFYRMTENLGYNLSPEWDGIAKDLEDIRTLAKQVRTDPTKQKQLDDKIADVVNNKIFRFNDKSKNGAPGQFADFTNSTTGGQIATLVTKVQGGYNNYGADKALVSKESKNDKLTPMSNRLLENIIQAWYELAVMFAASGYDPDTVTYETVPNNYITWLKNPADRDQFAIRSVLAIPTAHKNTAVDAVAFGELEKKDIKNISSDPAYSNLLVGISNVAGGTNTAKIESTMKSVNGPIISAAKQNFNATGTKNWNTLNSDRGDDPAQVYGWEPTSDDAVNQYFTHTVILGNAFHPGDRNRYVYRGGWPGFRAAGVNKIKIKK